MTNDLTFAERVALREASRAADRVGPEDALNFAVTRIEQAREILGRYSGSNPGIPTAQVMEDVIHLLTRAVNPNGDTGTAHDSLALEYPTDWLPPPMTAQLAAGGSLALSGIAAAMLGCGSAAAMSSRLIIDDTRRVVPTLWVPSIGDAGSGKTPAADLAWAPYHHRENVAAERYAAQMKEWAALDKKEREQMPRPVNESKLSEDATIEVLARRLNGNGECIALVADELSGTLRGIGQYKKQAGSDQARFLALWSGKSWTYERVGTGDSVIFIHVANPVFPVFGTIQPEFVSLLGDVGSGMQARWLPHLCPGRTGTETGRTADEWDIAIRVLLGDLYRTRAWIMPRDSEARKEHLQAEERWAAERQELHQTAASTSFLAKGGEHAARIALVLAEIGAAWDAAQRGDPRGSAGEIPMWAIRAGIDIVDYCAAVWRALPNSETPLARSFAEARIAERDGQLNAWLRTHGGSATKREIQRARVGGARTSDEVQALIDRHRAIHGDDSVVLEARGQQVVYAR